MIQIDLPWPDKVLSPNARVHWAVKARATKNHREWAHWASRPFGPILDDGDLYVTIIAYPPTRAAFDDDNFKTRCKAFTDGIADGLGVNDSRFRLQPLQRGAVVKHGNVRFEIQQGPASADDLALG